MSRRVCYLGIDFGTSGARAIVLDDERCIHAEPSVSFPGVPSVDLASLWQQSLWQLLQAIPTSIRRQIQAIAINGTSATVLLCDAQGYPVTPPLLYNDDCGKAVLSQIQAIAPADHPVMSATSSLAKLLWWVATLQCGSAPLYLLHQADWLSFLLHGQLGVSDYHNALKLGYDVGTLNYPAWLYEALAPYPVIQLPHVLAPGTPIRSVTGAIAQTFEFPPDCQVCAGTTDSIAAFLASGARHPGEAVTSLGSTLVLKLLSQYRVDHAPSGVYSHRWGDQWLVGGASNTGGAVLRHFFRDEELEHLSLQIPRDRETPLHYYPLLRPGERFPINDPSLQPQLTPRPTDPVAFLHGLLDGMARIEALGYQRLQALGATPVSCIYTAGGGAQNLTWQSLRDRYLPVERKPAQHTEAAYGTAQLARMGWRQTQPPTLSL